MNYCERYDFDLNGYLLVRDILSSHEVSLALQAADMLEAEVVSTVNDEPHYSALKWDIKSHYNARLGFSAYECDHGKSGTQYVVDDFLNADAAFDCFVGHPRTLEYVREMTESPFMISSSELRYRHKGNITATHMGGPIDRRNAYRVVPSAERPFDLLAVRVLYALHDIPKENGPLCVVPGSHKARYHSPYGGDPLQERGMVPLPMQAGDVLFFTENLRHGGYPNAMDRVRKTIHICYSPAWVGSQSPAHWDAGVHVTHEAWSRYSETQRAFLPRPAAERNPEALVLKSLGQRVDELTGQCAELDREKQRLEQALVDRWAVKSALRRLLGLREQSK